MDRGPQAAGEVVRKGRRRLARHRSRWHRLARRPCVMQTDDGALVFVHYAGRVDATVPAAPIYATPRFDTGDDRYRWLNRLQAVAKGRFDGCILTYELYELRYVGRPLLPAGSPRRTLLGRPGPLAARVTVHRGELDARLATGSRAAAIAVTRRWPPWPARTTTQTTEAADDRTRPWRRHDLHGGAGTRPASRSRSASSTARAAPFSVPELRVGNEVAEAVHQRAARRRQRPADRGRPLQHRRLAREVDRLRQPADRGRRGRRASRAPTSAPTPSFRCLTDAGIPLIGHVQFGAGPHVRPQLVLLRCRRHRLRRRRARSTTRTRAPSRSCGSSPTTPSSHALHRRRADADGREARASTTRPSTTTPPTPTGRCSPPPRWPSSPTSAARSPRPTASAPTSSPALRDAGYQGRHPRRLLHRPLRRHRRQGRRRRHRRRPLEPGRPRVGAAGQAGGAPSCTPRR